MAAVVAAPRVAYGVGVPVPVPVVAESNILTSQKRESHAARLVIDPYQEVATLNAVLSTADGDLGGAGVYAPIPVVEEYQSKIEITAQQPVVGVAGVGDYQLKQG